MIVFKYTGDGGNNHGVTFTCLSFDFYSLTKVKVQNSQLNVPQYKK